MDVWALLIPATAVVSLHDEDQRPMEKRVNHGMDLIHRDLQHLEEQMTT